MTLFVRGANPIWYMVDLIGLGLNDQYYIFFLKNTLPYIPYTPPAITHDPAGLIPWSNPIQFYPNGTLPDNMYFDGSLTYRIEVRKGNTQAAPLIYEINDWSPTVIIGQNTNSILTAENQITNPQFSVVDFSSTPTVPFVYTQAVNGNYQIDVAPGWTLNLTGQGTTKLTQLAIAGSGLAGNAPFALEIDNTGWTTAILNQRFQGNGALFAGGAISMYGLFRPYVSAQNISFGYVPSGGTGQTLIVSGLMPSGVFTPLKGTAVLAASNNNTTGSAAFTDVQVNLLGTGKIDVTNLQVVGQSTPLTPGFDLIANSPDFQQITIQRQIDQLFHVYSDSLITQPKNSILTGWNFPLNPYQFSPVALTNQAAQTSYVADQTILYQQATGNNILTGVTTADNSGGFELIPNVASGLNGSQFALIQYVDSRTIAPYWGNILSSMVKVRAFLNIANNTNIPIKMRLIWRTDLPPVLSNVEPIALWTLGGDPVFAAGWHEVKPLNDTAYVLPNAYVAGSVEEYPSFSFDQFQLPSATTTTMTLGVVVYTMNSMVPTAGVQDAIVFESISLVPNDFAIQVQSQTFDEALRQCQFYYEKSYVSGILPGATSIIGARFAPNPISLSFAAGLLVNTVLYKSTFDLVFNQVKRAAPVVHFYSPTGTIDNVSMGVWNGTAYPGPTAGTNPKNVAISQWSSVTTNTSNIVMKPNDANPIMTINADPGSDQGEIYYQYTADARLGV